MSDQDHIHGRTSAVHGQQLEDTDQLSWQASLSSSEQDKWMQDFQQTLQFSHLSSRRASESSETSSNDDFQPARETAAELQDLEGAIAQRRPESHPTRNLSLVVPSPLETFNLGLHRRDLTSLSAAAFEQSKPPSEQQSRQEHVKEPETSSKITEQALPSVIRLLEERMARLDRKITAFRASIAPLEAPLTKISAEGDEEDDEVGEAGENKGDGEGCKSGSVRSEQSTSATEVGDAVVRTLDVSKPKPAAAKIDDVAGTGGMLAAADFESLAAHPCQYDAEGYCWRCGFKDPKHVEQVVGAWDQLRGLTESAIHLDSETESESRDKDEGAKEKADDDKEAAEDSDDDDDDNDEESTTAAPSCDCENGCELCESYDAISDAGDPRPLGDEDYRDSSYDHVPCQCGRCAECTMWRRPFGHGGCDGWACKDCAEEYGYVLTKYEEECRVNFEKAKAEKNRRGLKWWEDLPEGWEKEVEERSGEETGAA